MYTLETKLSDVDAQPALKSCTLHLALFPHEMVSIKPSTTQPQPMTRYSGLLSQQNQQQMDRREMHAPPPSNYLPGRDASHFIERL